MAIYKLTRDFSREELFGLASQVRRAAFSVPANAAEGSKRKAREDRVRFFNISQSSLEEVRSYLILAKDLEYDDTEELKGQVDGVGRLLDAYMKSIAKK